MKKISTLAIIALLIVSIAVSSCKKTHSSTKSNNNDSITKLTQFFTVTVNDSNTYNYGNNPEDSFAYYSYDTVLDIFVSHQYFDSTVFIEFKTPSNIAVGSSEILNSFTFTGNTLATDIDGIPSSPIYVNINRIWRCWPISKRELFRYGYRSI
jgi:hypothetical protein